MLTTIFKIISSVTLTKRELFSYVCLYGLFVCLACLFGLFGLFGSFACLACLFCLVFALGSLGFPKFSWSCPNIFLRLPYASQSFQIVSAAHMLNYGIPKRSFLLRYLAMNPYHAHTQA